MNNFKRNMLQNEDAPYEGASMVFVSSNVPVEGKTVYEYNINGGNLETVNWISSPAFVSAYPSVLTMVDDALTNYPLLLTTPTGGTMTLDAYGFRSITITIENYSISTTAEVNFTFNDITNTYVLQPDGSFTASASHS